MRWQTMTGVAAGVLLAAAAMRFIPTSPSPHARFSGTPMSDCDGAFQTLVIHYVRDAEFAASVQAAFLPQLPKGVTVAVVTPDLAAFEQLRDRVGPTACELRPVVVGHALTPWSRDRWLSLAPTGLDAPITLLAPRGEAAEDGWPERNGDRLSATDVAASVIGLVARRSEFYFDGGDFVCDDHTVFVTPAVLKRNLQRTVDSKQALQQSLESLMPGRQVVLLNEAPPHHAGMFMMTATDKTVVVGDPSLARPLLTDTVADRMLPGGGDFSPATQARFDAVARQAAGAGYRVIRIPTVPAPDGRTYLTYVNAVIDERAGSQIVYLPSYEGVDDLNAAAQRVWRDLGYEVRAVDCTQAYRLGGCLRCMVNVASR